MEWPKEISKFFSRHRLASISQVGFRVINISQLGLFYKNWEDCGGCLTGRISGGLSDGVSRHKCD